MNRILIAVGLVVAILVGVSSCERIDAGHVGVKVNMFGSGKGVNDITEVHRMLYFITLCQQRFMNFQPYIQHKEYVRRKFIYCK
jgi:hypothetical protein